MLTKHISSDGLKWLLHRRLYVACLLTRHVLPMHPRIAAVMHMIHRWLTFCIGRRNT